MKKTMAIVIAAILMGGCATTAYRSKVLPQVTIESVTKKEVADALVSIMSANGYSVKSASDYNVVFSKRKNTFTSSSGYIITYSFVEATSLKKGIKVTGNAEYVSRIWNYPETVSAIPDQKGIQRFLNGVKHSLNTKKAAKNS